MRSLRSSVARAVLGALALLSPWLVRAAHAEPSLRPLVLRDLEPGARVGLTSLYARHFKQDEEGAYHRDLVHVVADGQVGWRMLRARASIPLRLATSSTPTYGGKHEDVALGNLQLGVAAVGELAAGTARLQGTLGVDVHLPTVTGLDRATVPDAYDARDVGRLEDRVVPRVHGAVAYATDGLRLQAEVGVSVLRSPDFGELQPRRGEALLSGGVSSSVRLSPGIAFVADLTFVSEALYPRSLAETDLALAVDVGVRASLGRTTVGVFFDAGLRLPPSSLGVGLEVIQSL